MRLQGLLIITVRSGSWAWKEIIGNVDWCRSRDSPAVLLLANKLKPSPHCSTAATKAN